VPIANTKDNLPLCEYLAERRKFMKLRASDLASRTGIPNKYIKKIEAGEWFDLPPGVYAKGFLKKYAKAVGLDENEAAQRYDLEIEKLKRKSSRPLGDNALGRYLKKKFFAISFFKRASLRTIVFCAAIVFILAYIGWQFNVVLKKPNLSVSRPTEDIAVSESKFLIEGKVSTGGSLTINNEPVYAEGDGSFKKEIELIYGLNVLEIKAISRFGKETKIIRRVTYQQ